MIAIIFSAIMTLVLLITGISLTKLLQKKVNADNYLNCNTVTKPDTAINAPSPQTKTNPGNSCECSEGNKIDTYRIQRLTEHVNALKAFSIDPHDLYSLRVNLIIGGQRQKEIAQELEECIRPVINKYVRMIEDDIRKLVLEGK